MVMVGAAKIIVRAIAVAGVVAANALVAGATAEATSLDGGATIASAPTLQSGVMVNGGAVVQDPNDSLDGGWWRKENPGTQYWKALVAKGDHVSLDYKLLGDGNLSICLLPPSVTDYTLSDAECYWPKFDYPARANQETPHRSASFTLPTPGTWTIVVGDATDLVTSDAWSYQLTATIAAVTRVSFTTSPSVVKRRRPFAYRGVVHGANSGQVELDRMSTSGWKPFAVAKIGRGGIFTVKSKPVAAGTYMVRAVFRGDSTHLPSSDSFEFSVI